MKTKANYFKIGVFVLSCLTVLIIGLVVLCADMFVDDVFRMETYINESVQGLKEGSALMHRGVDIGRIEKLTFVPQEYPMDINTPAFDTYGRYVMVVVTVNRKKLPGLGDDPQTFRRMMENQIKQGLRLKLSYQGITGLLLLQTEYADPQREPPLEVPWTPHHMYVPWTPSILTSFTLTADRLFQRLEGLDLEGLMQKTNQVLDSIETAIKDTQIKTIRQAVLELIQDIHQMNGTLQDLLGPIPDANDGNVRVAIQQFSDTLTRIDYLIADHEDDINRILTDLKLLSTNLREISDTLSNDPSQLLIPNPPQPSEIVK